MSRKLAAWLMCRWKIVSSLTTILAKCIRNMSWCTMIEFLICFSKISTPSIWRCTIISIYTLALNLILNIQWYSSRRPKMIPGNSSKKKRKSASDLKWKSCWNGRDTKPDLGTSTISILDQREKTLIQMKNIISLKLLNFKN